MTVDGAGSKWTNTGTYKIGVNGIGTLNIINGGNVDCTGYIGYNSGATGLVTISGAGSTWINSGDLYVGYGGTGSVTQTGGSISVAGTLYLGYDTTGNGTYNLNGGTLTCTAARPGQRNGRLQFRRRNPSGQRRLFFQLAHDPDWHRRQRECQYQRLLRYAFRPLVRHGRIDQDRHRHVDPLRRKYLQRSDHRQGRDTRFGTVGTGCGVHPRRC